MGSEQSKSASSSPTPFSSSNGANTMPTIRAIEAAEATKSASYRDAFSRACEREGTNDVTFDELLTTVNRSSSVYLSYAVIPGESGAINATLLTPNADRKPGRVRFEVLQCDVSVAQQLTDIRVFLQQLADEDDGADNNRNRTTSTASMGGGPTSPGTKEVPFSPSHERLAFLYDVLIKPFAADIKHAFARSGARTLVIVPHGPLFDVPWSQLIPSRSDHTKTLSHLYKIVHSCSASQFMRQNSPLMHSIGRGPNTNSTPFVLVQDTTVAGNRSTLLDAMKPNTIVDGSARGASAFDLKESGSNDAEPGVFHIACRYAKSTMGDSRRVSTDSNNNRGGRSGGGCLYFHTAGSATPSEAVVDTNGAFFNNELINFSPADTTSKHKTFSSAGGFGSWFADASDHSSRHESSAAHPEKGAYGETVADDAVRLDDIRTTHSVPLNFLGVRGTLSVPSGSIVVFDIAGRHDDVCTEGWHLPFVRGALLGGAQAVVVLRYPTQYRLDLLKTFYTALRAGRTAADAVQEAVLVTAKQNNGSANAADRGALAIYQ